MAATLHLLGITAILITCVSCQITLQVTGPTGPVKEGATITVTCTFTNLPKFKVPHVIKVVEQGITPPDTGKYIISPDTTTIASPFFETGRYTVRFAENGGTDVGTITITNVQGEDGGGSVGCEIPGEVEAKAVLIDVIVGPKQVYFNNYTDGDTVKVEENERVNLECHSNGSNPGADMKVYLLGTGNDVTNLTEAWAKRSQQPPPRYNNGGLVQVMHHNWIHNLERIEYFHNKKTLRCDATVPDLPTKSAAIKFDVMFSPKFNCSQTQFPEPGGRVAMVSCPVVANPDLLDVLTIVQWQWMDEAGMVTLNPKSREERNEYLADMMRVNDNTVNVWLKIEPVGSRNMRTYNLHVRNSRFEVNQNITLTRDTSGTSSLSSCCGLYLMLIVFSIFPTHWGQL